MNPGPTPFQSHFYLPFRLFQVFKSNALESEFYLKTFYLKLKKLECKKKDIENELDRGPGPLTEVLRYEMLNIEHLHNYII